MECYAILETLSKKKLFQKQLYNQNQDKYKKSEITVRYFACRTEKTILKTKNFSAMMSSIVSTMMSSIIHKIRGLDLDSLWGKSVFICFFVSLNETDTTLL